MEQMSLQKPIYNKMHSFCALKTASTEKKFYDKIFVGTFQNSFAGHEATLKFLLKSGMDVNVKDYFGNTALHLTCSAGYMNLVKLLVENEANITAATNFGFTPSLSAVSKGE